LFIFYENIEDDKQRGSTTLPLRKQSTFNHQPSDTYAHREGLGGAFKMHFSPASAKASICSWVT
jgi:hypothetical protein